MDYHLGDILEISWDGQELDSVYYAGQMLRNILSCPAVDQPVSDQQ